MRFLSVLMPRERQFFDMFNRHAERILAGGRVLEALLNDYDGDGNRIRRIGEIQDIKRDADKITHDTLALLHRTFVTPLDRNDIHQLISRMDDILDLIQDSAETLTLYDVHEVTPEAKQLGSLIRVCCERAQAAVALLSSMQNAQAILKLCQELDRLESDADRVMRGAISKLFREEGDTRQIIRLNAIYELLESATDK